MTVCPFCYGREEKTPREIFAIRPEGSRANTPGWKVRVMPNKYPALRIEGELDKRGVGLYDVMNGIGAHEVIVENPDHERSMAELSPAEISRTSSGPTARVCSTCARTPGSGISSFSRTTESRRGPPSPTPIPSSSPSRSPPRWRRPNSTSAGNITIRRSVACLRHSGPGGGRCRPTHTRGREFCGFRALRLPLSL